MISKLKEIMRRAETWPENDQAELAEYAEELEKMRGATYRATADELADIDDAEQSGIADDAAVTGAFRSFRRG